MVQAKYTRTKQKFNVTNKTGVFHTTKFQRRLQEGLFIATLALSSFLFLALLTYHVTDSGWSYVSSSTKVTNAGGHIGAWVADILLCAFGYVANVFPALLIYTAWMTWRQRFSDTTEQSLFLWRTLGASLILISSTALLDLHFTATTMPFGAGGVLGSIIHFGMVPILNVIGTTTILIAFLLTGITIFSGLSWLKTLHITSRGLIKMVEILGAIALRSKESMSNKWRINRDHNTGLAGHSNTNVATAAVTSSPSPSTMEVPSFKKPALILESKKMVPTIVKPSPIKTGLRVEKEKQMKVLPDTMVEGSFPSLLLLDAHEQVAGDSYTEEQLKELSRNVELKLKDFSIDARVVAVHPGPVVTRFELQLAAGTKVSRITSLAKDLARSLSVISVRVVEVIPGKSVIGLELPNTKREIVRLREVLTSHQYEHTRTALALALGKDISGQPVVVDLARMPHLLVAGTTGSGKSVCLNALLLSLLFKYTAQELRLIMIDPKMLELSIYEAIPHLLTPVVTNMKEAANALRWCVGEMERRYRSMMSLGVRNIAGYNHKIKEARNKGRPLLDPLWQKGIVGADDEEGPPKLQELPYIVVIADEYADMIMVVGKKVEELIARIAQKARAAGIHLILATQRPSVDVITGLIKANIPARIAFQVSSKIDSRTILDQSGAEQLLGHGDMLYLPAGSGIPTRIHGAFVADEEVHRVVQDWKLRGKPEYIDEILDGNTGDVGSSGGNASGGFGSGGEESFTDSEQDPLYDQAVRFITDARRVSVSSVQRRFKIGYNRAARIVEAMELAGVVGPMETNGNRVVLAPPPPKR